MPLDPSYLDQFPPSVGVYLMKDRAGRVLYVGKAKNLRSRLKQYYSSGQDDRPMVPFLLAQVEEISTILVDSEKEALLLENTLIKTHQPKYNALLKDDKTYCSIFINRSHPWPSIRIVRFKERHSPQDLYFGPYAHGYAARDMLQLLRELFPLRQCSDRELLHRTRPCILYELKRCLAPCVHACTQQEYQSQVTQLVRFLRGEDKSILTRLKRARKEAAEALEFERAAALHTTLQHLETSLEKQYVELESADAFDYLGLYREGQNVAVVQLCFREGKLCASQEYFFSENAQSDADLLTSFLLQHYLPSSEEKKRTYAPTTQKLLPHTVFLPLPVPDALAGISHTFSEEIAALPREVDSQRGEESVLATRTPLSENQILRAECEKCRLEPLLPLKICQAKTATQRTLSARAEANAKAYLQRRQALSRLPKKETPFKEELLLELEERLALTNYPGRIECFDHSHLSGTEMVSAMVVFLAGEKARKEYRTYKIESAKAGDDYAALKEVLLRRYQQKEGDLPLPDLVLIDGGKGHLNVAHTLFAALSISTIDLIALSKEEGKHTQGLTAEKLLLPGEEKPLLLDPHDPLLRFLQQIRDEAHRFVLSFQKKRRKQQSLTSTLSLPGIGPTKRERLLRHFGSWKRIFDATPEAWKAVKGLTAKDIETLKRAAEEKNQ